MPVMCYTCVRVCAVYVWVIVSTYVYRRCLPKCGKIPSWVQNSSFQQQVRWAHLSCVQNQNNTWQLWQLWRSPNCNVSAWLDPEEYWACARQQDWNGRRQNAKSVFSRFEFSFISSSLEGRREMQNLYLPVLNLVSFPVLLKVGEKCSCDEFILIVRTIFWIFAFHEKHISLQN